MKVVKYRARSAPRGSHGDLEGKKECFGLLQIGKFEKELNLSAHTRACIQEQRPTWKRVNRKNVDA